MIKLYKEDAFKFLEKLPKESVDLIITDPPYASLEKYRSIGTTTRLKISKGSSNIWFPIIPNDRLPELIHLLYRVLRKNSHAYIFCDDETSNILLNIIQNEDFIYWGRLVWDKVNIGMGYHYRKRYEFILFLEKGKRKLRDLGVSNVLSVPRVHKGYPTEKPVDLLKILIKQSSTKGELICDPFFGSGSIVEACKITGRSFIGTDISEEAHKYVSRRLNYRSLK